MARLSEDYEHIQSTPSTAKELLDDYRYYFSQGQIDSAQGLIDSSNDQLVLDASKLNSLVETINYMQAFWAEDKEKFIEWLLAMCDYEAYDSTKTYHTGAVVSYDDYYYICISDDTTGSFNPSYWIRLGSTDVGLNFIGEYDSSATYNNNDLVINVINNIPTWQYYNGSSWVTIGYMYGNLRYLEDPTDAYDGEIYITPGANS